jgi:hypothetical protein
LILRWAILSSFKIGATFYTDDTAISDVSRFGTTVDVAQRWRKSLDLPQVVLPRASDAATTPDCSFM